MTSHERSGSTSEWDPLQDDTSLSQFPDEDLDGIDYKKLYITKIPESLNKSGFDMLFSRFGNVVHTHLSRDATKKFGFVTYETAGEARIAIMKLHRMEPCYLNVVYAKLKNNRTQSQTNNSRSNNRESRQNSGHDEHSRSNMSLDRHQQHNNSMDKHQWSNNSMDNHQRSNNSMDRHQSNIAERHHSNMSSDGHKQSNISMERQQSDRRLNGQAQRNVEDHSNIGDDSNDTDGSNVSNPKLEYDLEMLKLQRLQVQDEKLKVQQRMLIQQQRMKNSASISTTTRRVLPDGRVSIQVTKDETSLATGAGDSLIAKAAGIALLVTLKSEPNGLHNIPGLQREQSRRCVTCGAAGELFCAGCRVTPYCGERCQRRDWHARHSAVCHNLARSSCVDVEIPKSDGDKEMAAAAPTLRRPAGQQDTKCIPPGEVNSAHQQAQRQANFYRTTGNSNELGSRPTKPSHSVSQDMRGNQPIDNSGSQGGTKNLDETDFKEDLPCKSSIAPRRLLEAPRQPLRKPAVASSGSPKPTTEPVETKPLPHTKQEVPKTVQPKHVNVASSSVTQRKPLVPSSCVIQKLAVGDVFMAEVVEAGVAGFVCLTLNEDYADVYLQLCDEFTAQCAKDSDEYTPCIGETLAYFCKDDEGWYRARCLSPTRGALLDSGRLVSLAPSVCRKLPSAYTSVPEFTAVIKMEGLQIGANLACTILSTSSSAVKVTVTEAGAPLGDAGAPLGDADAVRWAPIVEYPQEIEPTTRTVEPIKEPAEPVKEPVDPVRKPAEPMRQPGKPIQLPMKQVETPVAAVQPARVIRKPLVPDSYLVGKLSANDLFMCEVVCVDARQGGCTCVTMHADYGDTYARLLDDFAARCEADDAEYTPKIGETFAYYNSEDAGWYRARCLARTRGALIDAGRVVSLAPSVCRRLPSGLGDVPEFVAVICEEKLAIGSTLSCLVISTSPKIKVRVTDEHDKPLGEFEAMRWDTPVEYPAEPAAAAGDPTPAAAAATIPSVPRPPVQHNNVYVLCDASAGRVCVLGAERTAQDAFHGNVHDAAHCGLTAKQLTEPPQKGDLVLAKFLEDGMYYRAFVRRVNVSKNKYLIEYVEYGNEEIVPLERLYPCPAKLSLTARPAVSSLARLSERDFALNAAAQAYLDNLKDNAVELLLSVPGGAKNAPSGSVVNLQVARSHEQLNKKVEDLCTAPWKRLAARGGDVLETESRSFQDLKYNDLPAGPLSLVIPCIDKDSFAFGVINAHVKGDSNAALVFGELTEQMAEYCESSLCKDPYLPKAEELCIVKNQRNNKWCRAVVAGYPDGPGSRTADVVFVDYGTVDVVPTSSLRKMMPEFVDSYPAVTRHLEIKGFPHGKVTSAQLERAMRLMNVTSSGGGELRALSAREIEDKMCELVAPELIEALTQ